jgi:pimeloyl-ACP methyl ester carboxylesterase
MTRNHYKPLILLLFFLISPILQASDLAKEKRWADQIVDALITGEAEWLPVGELKVLSIYTPSEVEPARGAAIILHGIGVHPDWPDVIHPLRTRLPEAGWATLSVQMPILPNEASGTDYLPLLPEVPARINAAIVFLQEQGFEHVVLIAHSLGTVMSSYYLTQQPTKAVQAFVGISMSEIGTDPRMSNVAMLKNITIPVLDIYGSLDEAHVRDYVQQRQQSATSASNSDYRQVEIKDANHFYNGKDNALLAVIEKWLASQTITK